MKNKCIASKWAVAFFMMTLVVAFFSWIANIYGWGPIESLFSEEGLRWILNHTIPNYTHNPVLGNVMVLLMGIGVGVQAGFYNTVSRIFRLSKQISRKERQSFLLAVMVGVIYLVVVIGSVPFLKSITGDLVHSPLYNGFFYVVSIGLGLLGVSYGLASNVYNHLYQIFTGMTCLIARYADYFVALFFIVLFFTILNYTHVSDWMKLDKQWVDTIYLICCCLPLIKPYSELQQRF